MKGDKKVEKYRLLQAIAEREERRMREREEQEKREVERKRRKKEKKFDDFIQNLRSYRKTLCPSCIHREREGEDQKK